MEIITKLLQGNKDYVREVNAKDPEFFARLAQGQEPEVLWIGCSDSRSPANEITNTVAGEIFVHRNIANMVIHTDMNLLSVLDYAVNVLGVKHVVVCGHYMCGGVRAAMDVGKHTLAYNWIRHIKDIYRLYEAELEAIEDFDQRFDRFVEINVHEQVLDLVKTSIIQNAWADSEYPYVHGWVFDVRTGRIKDMGASFSRNTAIPANYKIEGKVVSG